MATKLTYTNAASQQKDLTPWNHQNGCKVFENDTDQSLLYMQLRDDNTCVVDSVDGYTELYQIDSTVNTNNLGKIESKIDVSKYVNAGSITVFNYEDVDNRQLFAKWLNDYWNKLFLYNTVIDDKCLRNTLDYCKITYLIDDNGNVIINEDETPILL